MSGSGLYFLMDLLLLLLSHCSPSPRSPVFPFILLLVLGRRRKRGDSGENLKLLRRVKKLSKNLTFPCSHIPFHIFQPTIQHASGK